MPSKLQFYSEFAERTARQITGSYRSWTAFLATAARLYKYPYNEQLIVWHEDCTFYSRKAIHNHISNVKKKLRTVASGQQCIVSVHGVGYKFDVTQNNE